ncbi:PLAA family ubiquitin binding, PFU [Kalmanozyma brasiliensis GHG001]|uniref:PFU domain-containing protein n=1 Tax=Kalmanozyma brasiliensis (strain GHG001) TaxID=1365824 RepID=V5EQ21_KALBG|nr:PLAA family ubiquitin binding, PFU [Kalmanozyma brasiliensis GHG001]EST07215.1 PLAA family ubiquitin binding, PFU [Kalmanozyma brasiliensis GHG001]
MTKAEVLAVSSSSDVSGTASVAAPQGFRLTHVLRGHTSDVRSVATTFDSLSVREALLSGSRDETATYWSRSVNPSGPSSNPNAGFERGAIFHGHRFCNAVDFVTPSPSFELPQGQILMGSLDSQIRCFDPLRADKPLQVLSDHWDNVSVLKAYRHRTEGETAVPVFISASWDKTARVWIWDPVEGKWKSRLVLRGHDEAVWGVQIVEPPSSAVLEGDPELPNQGRYLTSSADLFIRLFHGEQLYAVYAGHTDVVRSLHILPTLPSSHIADVEAEEPAKNDARPPFYPDEQLFASTSNDGTIRIWSLDARRSPNPGNGGEALGVLHGHTSLVYDVAAYIERGTGQPRLVSSGEDGSFRVWDWVSGKLLQTVPVPVVSVWSISVLPQTQDVVAGCSDGLVRIYSRRPCPPSAADSEFSGAPLSESELADEVQRAQDVQAQLTLATQAKESSTEASPDEPGQMHDGKSYDYVLQIDVSDDAEPLPFPINRDDDRRQGAADFVALHQLPESYVERIVEFVNLVLG